MKTKLLRKIRKRFSWRLETEGNPNYGTYLVMDHQKQVVTKASGFRGLLSEIIYVATGFDTYHDWLRRHNKRARRAEYLRTLKPSDEL